jgi:cytochrome c biogenesis protein CcmG/thiol:disulfide interchange protein DsbE
MAAVLYGREVDMRHRLWPALAACLVLMACGASGITGDARGTRAAPFRLPDIRAEARSVDLAGFRGRPVVLNFWSTTCVPCRKEMPALQSVASGFAGRVTFVGIDHEDTRPAAQRFLDTTGVSYAVGFDPVGATAEAYRLRGLPTTVFIRSDATILLRHTGPLTRAQLLEGVHDLLDADRARSPSPG